MLMCPSARCMQEHPVPHSCFMHVVLCLSLNGGIIMNSRENVQRLRDLTPPTYFCCLLLPSLVCCHQVDHISFCKKPFLLCWYRKTCESNIHHSGDDTAKPLTLPGLFIITEMTKISSLEINVKISTLMLKVTPVLEKRKCHYSTSFYV